MFASFISNNPLTRNRVVGSVKFAKNEAERNALKVPAPTFSFEKIQSAYDNMVVPNQLPDPTKTASGGLVQYDKTSLKSDEWTKWRFIERKNPHGDWSSDPWEIEDMRKEEDINRRSAAYARLSKVENAKLMAELEKDSFRKTLLSDLDSGRLFPKSRLIEVSD